MGVGVVMRGSYWYYVDLLGVVACCDVMALLFAAGVGHVVLELALGFVDR